MADNMVILGRDSRMYMYIHICMYVYMCECMCRKQTLVEVGEFFFGLASGKEVNKAGMGKAKR